MIVVYGKGPSCKALAGALDGFWWSSETNRTYRWLRTTWTRARIPDADRVVCYGKANLGDIPRLNHSIVHNKLTQLQRFRSTGLPVPDFTQRTPEEAGWLARRTTHMRGTDIQTPVLVGQGYELVHRTVGCSCACGHEHTRQVTESVDRPRRVEYPQADYYVRYIPKDREFRVHVINDVVVRIAEKVPQDPRAVVWNSDNSHFNFATIAPDRVRVELRRLGKAAVVALGMDFGAVDIMLHNGAQFYVLEVNSAPNLADNPTTLERYAAHIREWAEGGN